MSTLERYLGSQNLSDMVAFLQVARLWWGHGFVSDYVIKLGIESGFANTFDG